MITIRKLASLKDDTRRRKYPLLMQHFEEEIKRGRSINKIYLRELTAQVTSDPFYDDGIRRSAERLLHYLDLHGESRELLWQCNSLKNLLLSAIGGEPGDWDFSERGEEGQSERISGDLYLYLDGIRSPFNVGSIFRTAESFGIGRIILSEETCSPEHNRAKRSSMGCIDIVPWDYGSIDNLVEPLFALELGGKSLETFPFPQKGTLIIGSEELGVSPAGLRAADDSLGRLSIRTGGYKGSINVSVATGIALQKWFSTIF